MHIALILLAAGGSTRLGLPKQLLTFQGHTLLRRAAEAALATLCRPVIVVLGAGAEPLQTELAGLAVDVAENPGWEAGMGTSVRLGIETLLGQENAGRIPAVDGALLTLCDQPFVGPESLNALIAAFESGRRQDQIAAAMYHDTVGVPVLFGRAFFDDLRALPDEAGAKPILRRQAASVLAVSMPEAATDIDTRAQYESLVKL